MVTMAPAEVFVQVLCGGFLKQGSLKGKPCQKPLARVSVSKWQESMNSVIEIQCPRCGDVTRLRDFA
jgi:hypothetical protein